MSISTTISESMKRPFPAPMCPPTRSVPTGSAGCRAPRNCRLLREGHSTPAWGLLPRPGTGRVYVFPGARDGRLIADVVRLDKGHTEGLEPNITEKLIAMMVAAPGGKAQRL